MGLKAFFAPIFGVLLGIFILYSQFQNDSERKELKTAGQITDGKLLEATRHRVNFIPMGYSFKISYSGHSKKFDVSKKLFYSHVDADDKYKVNETISVTFMPNRPNTADLPEMLESSAWWFGGPWVNYPMACFILFGSMISLIRLSRYR